jgi:hypothetical protein
MVFLYHDDPLATYRWLVDDAGHPVDVVAFRKSPPGWPERYAASTWEPADSDDDA